MKNTRFKFFVTNVIMILFLVVTVGNVTAYGAENIPKVEKIVYEHNTVYEGDTQTIQILSKYTSKVQYKVWICNRKTGIWQDITNGYTSSMSENQIFSITTPKLSEGNYTISVWIKRAGATPLNKRGFDSFLASTMNCLKSNGQPSKIKLTGFKNNYSKGEAIEIKKQEDKQYLYKFSVYDVLKNKTIVSYAKDYKDSLSWKTSSDGIYLFKVNLKSIEKVEVPKNEDKENEEKEIENKEIEENINQEKTNEEKPSEENVKEEEKSKDSIKEDEAKTEKVNEEKTNNEKSLEESIKEEEKNEDSIKEDQINTEDINEEKTSQDSVKEDEESEEKLEQEKETEDKEKDVDEKDEKEEKEEVEYKEIVTEQEITKLIIVGNPERRPKEPSKPSNGKVAPKSSALTVGNANENTIIYVKSQPKSNSKNVGYIYGSLHGIKILKQVGSYYYIEAIDYGTCNRIKGYVRTNQVKTVKPNQSYSVLVELSEQRVYVFKDDKLIRTIICSTGNNWTPTPIGAYLIGDKGPSFLTGTNNSVICYNWVRFNHNYLFHSVLCTRNGQVIQSEAAKLGSKASHGCIRMPINDIKWFYNTIPRGTLVVIKP